MATVKKTIGRLPVYKGDWVAGTYSMLNQVSYLGSTFQSKIDNNTSQPATVVNNALQVNANWNVISNGTAAYLADSRLTSVEDKTVQLEQYVNIKSDIAVSYADNSTQAYCSTQYYYNNIVQGDFTIIMEAKLDNRNERQAIISKGTSSDAITGFIIINWEGIIKFSVNGKVAQHKLRDGYYHKYAFVKKGNELSIFCDNVLSDRVTSSTNISCANDKTLAIGINSHSAGYNNPFTGSVGNIAIYERAIADSDLKTKMISNDITDADYLLSPTNHLSGCIADLKGNRISTSGGLQKIVEENTSSIFLSVEAAKRSGYENPTIGRMATVGRGDNIYIQQKERMVDITLLQDWKKKVAHHIYYIDGNAVGYAYGDGYLKKTVDFSIFENILSIPNVNCVGITPCNDGGLFIHSNKSGNELGSLYKVNKEMTSAVKVLSFRNEYQTHPVKWTIRSKENVVFFSEYGNSPAESGIGTKADATRIYKSEDYGNTFNEWINLNDLTDIYPVDNNLHIHSIEIDSYDNCLWVTSGDGSGKAKSNKKIVRINLSDKSDYSATELSSYHSNYIIENGASSYDNLQGLSMFCFRDYILIGADCYRNGIYRANKDINNKFIQIEDAYEMAKITTDITHYSGKFKEYNGVVYIPMPTGDSGTPEGMANHRPFILATKDGFHFAKIYDSEYPRVYLNHFDIFFANGSAYITEMYYESFYVKKFSFGGI